MLPERVSNPGPLTYESGALPIALRGPALLGCKGYMTKSNTCLFATVLCLIPENVYGRP